MNKYKSLNYLRKVEEKSKISIVEPCQGSHKVLRASETLAGRERLSLFSFLVHAQGRSFANLQAHVFLFSPSK